MIEINGYTYNYDDLVYDTYRRTVAEIKPMLGTIYPDSDDTEYIALHYQSDKGILWIPIRINRYDRYHFNIQPLSPLRKALLGIE